MKCNRIIENKRNKTKKKMWCFVGVNPLIIAHKSCVLIGVAPFTQVTHVRIKNSIIQGMSPIVVKVICLIRKEFAPSNCFLIGKFLS